jgi:hypothetical protein
MDPANSVFLTIAFVLVLLAWQRTVSKRRWLTLLVIVVPVVFFTFRWARFKKQLLEWQLAAGIAIVSNALFWIVYGRTHPPGYKGDITVLGMEDEE